jgi:homoserine/homoserine lactone efflux protein
MAGGITPCDERRKGGHHLYSDRLILFFLTDLVFCLTPGPATMVTIGHVLGGGLRAGLGPVAGVHIGNFIWYGLSAIGLMALIAAAPNAYALLRWAGVLYLLVMGIRIWRRNVGAGKAIARRGDFRHGFLDGLAVHMANPKALIFYAAFVPQFVDPHFPILPQIMMLAGITLVTESIGMGTYALLAAGANRFALERDWTRLLQRLSGGAMISVALIMAWANSQTVNPL